MRYENFVCLCSVGERIIQAICVVESRKSSAQLSIETITYCLI